MSPEAIIEKALGMEVVLFLKDDGLSYRTPAGKGVPEALRDEIVDNKAAIVEYLRYLEAQADASPRLPAIVRRESRGDAPLSYGQQQLMLVDRIGGGSRQFNIQGVFRAEGALDVEALRKAVHCIIERHEVLRTNIAEIDGTFRQSVATEYEVPFGVCDLSVQPIPEREQRLAQLIRDDAQAPFDLGQGLMLRIQVVKLSEREHAIVLCMHHIASDGWSLSTFAKELKHFYAQAVSGKDVEVPPLAIQYADYAGWQRELLKGTFKAKAVEFWKGYLKDIPHVHALPLDHGRLAEPDIAAIRVERRLDSALLARLKSVCNARGATLFMLLQTAFSLLLHRFSRQCDIVVGTPMSGRIDAALEPLLGLFINTVVLRNRFDSERTFAQHLQTNKDGNLAVHEYQYLPFELLVEELNPPRSSGYNPIFQIWFVLQNNERVALELPDCVIRRDDSAQVDSAKHELNLYASEEDGGLTLAWVARKALFEPDTVAYLSRQFERLLEAVAAEPERKIADYPLFDSAQAAALLDRAGMTVDTTPVLDRFRRQVATRPDAVAIRSEGREISYRELDTISDRFAAVVAASEQSRIGLCLNHGADMVVAIWACIKAGKTYVPLNPEYPLERLRYIVADAGIGCVVKNAYTEAVVTDLGAARLIDIGMGEDEGEVQTPTQTAPAKLAYVLYTSGSTGKPKGVLQRHRHVAYYVDCYVSQLRICPDDRLLQVATFSHDAAVLDMFAALTSGACLQLMDLKKIASVDILAAIDDGITIYHSSPSVFKYLFAQAQGYAFPALRAAVFGGEALDAATLRLAGQCLPDDCEVANLYGSSEATLVSLHPRRVREGLETCRRIAEIMPGSRLRVVAAHGGDADVYEHGELVVESAAVAEGYLNLPKLTAERFAIVDDDLRAYRTGDLGYLLPDGSIHFLGRRDSQFKLNGQRIEPEEIEAALLDCPGVRSCVVVLKSNAGGGDAFVAAFVTTDDDADAWSELERAIRQRLALILPLYMVPATISPVQTLPRTASGKIDRNALSAPESPHFYRQTHVAAETELEIRLQALWRGLLGRDEISATAGFFEAGGHSLLATRLASGIREEFEVELSLREIFDHPTIREQAALIAAKPASTQSRVCPGERPEKLTLSDAQKRIWFVASEGRSDSNYNIAVGLSLVGRLDRPALLRAVGEVFRRHEILRTTYHVEVDGLWQRVQPDASVAISEIDWSSLESPQQQADLRRFLVAEGAKPFDLSRDLMLRVTLIALGDQEHVLILTLHHIAADGWSMGVLAHEFGALYSAYSQGQSSVLPALPVQYADYALWQQAQMQTLADGLAYWSRQLAAAPELTTLPTDRPRPTQMPPQGANHHSELPAALMERVRSFCHARGVTPFMLLESVLALLVGRYGDQRDVVIGTPVAGRTRREVEPLVGCFVNILALRTRLTPAMRFDELLANTRMTVVDAYGQQGVPFDRVVDRLQVERSLSHSPLFQILFTLQNTVQRPLALPELTVTALPYAAQTTKYDLELAAWEHEGGMRLSWQFATALFDAVTIERLSTHFRTLLAAALDAPETPVYRLPMLTEDDRARWQAWNCSAKDYPRDCSVHSLFEAQVQRTPLTLAATDGQRELSYGELDAWANRAAHALREQGVGAGSVVGLHVGRSLEQVVGVLAILKAGGAYLPLEPEHPDARLAYMCADSGVRRVLSVRALAERCAAWSEGTLCLDDEAALSAYPRQVPVVDDLDPQQLAYVIYTSGSTGQPKGVLVPHRGLVNYLDHARSYLQPHHRGAVMGTPLSFDATVTTLFSPLLTGKCLVVLPSEVGALFAGLSHYLFHEGNDWLFKLTPAHLGSLYANYPAHTGSSPRRHCLVIGGEQLMTATVSKWQRDRLPHAEYINEYGPTETVVGCSVYAVRSPDDLKRCGHAVAIGRPIQNTRLYVLNELDEPVPAGAVGELCIGGDGVTRGYQNLEALTASRFREHRFANGVMERLYHSGDLVRCRRDGELEYLGRRDEQVKLRGYRIELGEIEGQLKRDQRVGDAAAVIQGEGDDRRLVAFVASTVSESGHAALVGELQQALRRTLAEYMRPAAIAVMARLPLTSNGKVDRASLPVLTVATAARYRAPETQTEHILAALWQELLERNEPVGAEDNFFRLGGHSLLATRMVLAINQRWPAVVQLRDIFEQPSLSGLALHIDAKRVPTPAEEAGSAKGSAVYEEVEW